MTWLASFYINHPIMCYIAPSLRVDGRGDIFFRSRPVGACRLGACLRLPCSAWGGCLVRRLPLLLARACSYPIMLPALAASSFRSGGYGDFFISTSPSCRLLFVCLPHIAPPARWVGEVRASCLFAVCGRLCGLLALLVFRAAHSARRSFALPRRSPRCCFFSPGVPSPVACLAVAMSSRRASSLPPGSRACPPLVRGGLRFASCLRACPSSVISHPLSVIRLMWLVVPSCGGFHCPLSACLPVSSARCWYMPVMLRYVPRPVLACRGAGRVMAVAVVVSLVGDLFVLLRGRRLVRSVSLRGG